MVDFHKQKQQETNQNNSQNDPRNAKSVSREKKEDSCQRSLIWLYHLVKDVRHVEHSVFFMLLSEP